MRQASRRKVRIGVVAAVLGAVIAFVWLNRVDNTITEEDREYLALALEQSGTATADRPVAYEDEVRLIASIQEAVFRFSPHGPPIPRGQSREPKDLFQWRSGQCYDRSRTIEKALRLRGFQTRHVSIYSTVNTGSKVLSVLTPDPTHFPWSRVNTHAVTEVLTKKGWLVVDPVQPWMSLDPSGDPVALQEIQAHVERGTTPWSSEDLPNIQPILKDRFTFVYGMYSRHGYFFPPFLPFPDIHWGEFLDNVI